MCNSCVPDNGGCKAMVFEQSLVSIKYAKLELIILSGDCLWTQVYFACCSFYSVL